MITDAPVSSLAEVRADPDPGYRWKHVILALLMVAGGAWFAYDGWVKWPAENRYADKVKLDKEKAQGENDAAKVESLAKELSKVSKHTDLDIMLQKALAFTLPAFGIFWGGWTLFGTRGAYRLEGDVLHVPGHSPIKFDEIRRIDKRKWDRKGIAFLHYQTGNPPKEGTVRLDDFAYERKGTDEILARIERHVMPTPMVEPVPSSRSTTT